MATNDFGEIPRIELQRPSQLIAAELRQRILRGDWREGVPLPPASVLAKRLGISRHHLREALRLLEHDGLIRVERGPTGGISLAIPDEEAVSRILEGILARYGTPLIDVNEALAVLESAVAGHAAEHATAEDIAKLEAIIEQEQSEGWWHTACSDFHKAVAHATHNQPLVVLSEASWPVGKCRTEEFPEKLEAIKKRPAVGKEAVQRHRELVQAIADRDSTKAQDLMREHDTEVFAHFEPTLRGVAIGAAANL